MPKNMDNTLVYYDIGGYNKLQPPFRASNRHFLKRAISIDPNFESDIIGKKHIKYKFAVSDEEGERDFYASNWRNGSLYEYTSLHQSYHKPRDVIKVQCKKLSNVIKNHGGEIDVLKIDAHGSEMPILNDVKEYIGQMTAIQVEGWYSEWYKNAQLLDVLRDFMDKVSFYPSTIVGYWPGYAIDILYVNTNAPDEDKLKLVKELWGVTEQTAREAKVLVSALETTRLE